MLISFVHRHHVINGQRELPRWQNILTVCRSYLWCPHSVRGVEQQTDHRLVNITCRVVELQFNFVLFCSAGKFPSPLGITGFRFWCVIGNEDISLCAIHMQKDRHLCKEAFITSGYGPCQYKSGACAHQLCLLCRQHPLPLPDQCSDQLDKHARDKSFSLQGIQ